MINHQFYDNFEIIQFDRKTPGDRDSDLPNSQFFHAGACVRCCAGHPWVPYMVRSTLCNILLLVHLRWENQDFGCFVPKITIDANFQQC